MPSPWVSMVTDTLLHPALELPARTKPNPATNHFQPLRGVGRPQTKMTKVSTTWALTQGCQG